MRRKGAFKFIAFPAASVLGAWGKVGGNWLFGGGAIGAVLLKEWITALSVEVLGG